MERKILETEDGSSTIFVPGLGEHYHSFHGAVQESMHVFIERGLNVLESTEIRVFELGFGTGLNALLTFLNAREKEIEYTSIEKYPVEIDMAKRLNYSKTLNLNQEGDLFFKMLHEAEWGLPVNLRTNFKFKKIQEDIKAYNHISAYNLVYFDAFAPDVQPDLWSADIFQNLYDAMETGGILTTYCAKGIVRRTMQQCGFTVERLPGPPGKREILRGIK